MKVHFTQFTRSLWLGIVLAGTLVACGPIRRGASSASRALLVFNNQSLHQADVYAVIPGSEAIRIGTVFPGRTDTLSVPIAIVDRGQNFNVVARLFANGGTPQTGPIALRPGESLEITLPVDGKLLAVVPTRP
jgi:hypothetical protein